MWLNLRRAELVAQRDVVPGPMGCPPACGLQYRIKKRKKKKKIPAPLLRQGDQAQNTGAESNYQITAAFLAPA